MGSRRLACDPAWRWRRSCRFTLVRVENCAAKSPQFHPQRALAARRLASKNLCPSVPQTTSTDDRLPSELQLQSALQLLELGGYVMPPDVLPGSPAWLQSVIDGLCNLSSRDALTGLANRRPFELALAREVDRVARAGEPALVLMADIDHFKRINDTHGHPAGDQVLKSVAQTLLDCVRPMDTLARFGGEEFAIILPNCPAAFGQTVAERIRRKVETRPIAVAPGVQVSVTISLGGAFAPQWVRSSAALWVERADRQLYLAKAGGRNRACLESTAVAQVSAEEKGLLFGTSQFQDLLE